MTTLTLTRNRREGKAVYGQLSFEMRNREYALEPFAMPSLENADYLIPAGTYPVERTWSPRFKKFLPLIENVPDREGIRIHRGALPEHSKGCILLDLAGMSNINILFNQLENEDEKAQIEIIDRYAS